MAIGAPAVMKVGGVVSSGPAAGLYHVEVTESALGVSSAKGTPYIELTLTVKDDPDHEAKEGKTLLKQRFYGPGEHHDAEKAETMQGMLKRGIFKGFGVAWPKENGVLDARKFAGKAAWVLVAKERKPQDPADARMEVQRISQDKTKLEAAAAALESAPEAGGDAAPTAAPKPAARSRR